MLKSQVEHLKVFVENESMSTSDVVSDIEDSKTLKHIVLFRFKKDTSEDAINHVLQRALSLQNSIPQVLSVQAGPNLSEALNGGFTHGFIVELADQKGKEEFMEHNEQADVMRDLIPILENIIQFDLY